MPIFNTNLVKYGEEDMNGRVIVPLADEAAKVTYYLLSAKGGDIVDAALSNKNISAVTL